MTNPLRAAGLSALVLLAGCDFGPENPDQAAGRSLAEIKQSGKLVVLTRNAPTTWYIGRNGKPTGFEYEMAESFADSLGVETEYKLRPSLTAILNSLEKAEGDLAAAGLTATEERWQRFRFGPSYQEVTQQVVCRRNGAQPDSMEDLKGMELKVAADSSYAQHLATLERNGHPDLDWQTTSDTDTEGLLRQVWEGELQCTVADSTIVAINRRYFPELIAPLDLTGKQPLAWALPGGSDELATAVDAWLEGFRSSGRLEDLKEKYYGFFKVFDYVDTRTFIRRIHRRLPQYRELFRQAARKYDLPFTLLAAQAYQESHWQAHARSPTGVRGIMMLTLPTASAVGVTNRLEPRQSIFGGAKYMVRMKQQFGEKVTEPDRTWLALAAYNVGRGHLHDAQTLARRQGISPHQWRTLKQVLPLLSRAEYYRDLKYGYARGYEPVRYVRRIREYRHILERELR